MADHELPLLVAWDALSVSVMARTARMPKSVRFTFATRIDGLMLDVACALAEARYADRRDRTRLLADADAGLTRLRVLNRLAHQSKTLDHAAYEAIARGLDECGRMLGGWRQHVGSDR
jgi:hypothetical protein